MAGNQGMFGFSGPTSPANNWPDAPPVVAAPENDEFDGPLAPKWAESIAGTVSREVNGRWPSWYRAVLMDGSADVWLRQSFAPSGDFSLTAKFSHAAQVNYQSVGLAVFSADEQNQIVINNSVSTQHIFVADVMTNNSWSWRVKGFSLSTPTMLFNSIFLHLQRIGSNYYGGWSFNGLSFYRMGGTSPTFTQSSLTIAKLGLHFSNGTAAVQQEGGFDWLRRDWLWI